MLGLIVLIILSLGCLALAMLAFYFDHDITRKATYGVIK